MGQKGGKRQMVAVDIKECYPSAERIWVTFPYVSIKGIEEENTEDLSRIFVKLTCPLPIAHSRRRPN